MWIGNILNDIAGGAYYGAVERYYDRDKNVVSGNSLLKNL